MFADFILNLFHCVTNTHVLHLSSRSYSEHMALGDFYEGLDDLADSLAEAYQGKYGIPTYTAKYENTIPTNALAYLEGVSAYVSSARQEATYPQDSELQNITDEIQALINTTIYKLRYLK